MSPTVRVLVVTEDWLGVVDGGFLKWRDQSMPDAVGDRAREFHLGEFVSVLQDTHWVGFNVEITRALRPTTVDGASSSKTKARTGADVVDFRFDHPFAAGGTQRTIDDYHVILYFAMTPGYADTSLQSEADAIARYMAAGGGFFATGDHQDLGGTLCALVPRVRSMRRWFYGSSDFTSPSPPSPSGDPGAPSALGPDRHDTTQPSDSGTMIFENQSDEIAQPITPSDFRVGHHVQSGGAIRITESLPHPLLCCPLGRITVLPDHMHEGTCEVPGSLQTRTYVLDGKPTREYPDLGNHQPLAPVVVATGTVRAGTTSPIGLEPAGEHTGGKIATTGESFGVIGAYDGHLVGIGRVVVDSTFHHFFDINLSGDRYIAVTTAGPDSQYLHGFYVKDAAGNYEPNDDYIRIQWYFRNLIYWLIPDSVQSEIPWFSLLPVIRHSGLTEQLYGRTLERVFTDLNIYHYFYFGSVAERYLRSVRGYCYHFGIELVLFQKPRIPWWEWIQQWIPVGDPEPPVLSPVESVVDQFAVDIGLGPHRAALTTATLGAALVAIAAARADGDNVTDRAIVRRARQMAPAIVSKAIESYVRLGRETQERTTSLFDALERGASEFTGSKRA